MITILKSIISIIANAVFYMVLKMDLYTDRYYLPDGELHTWQRSPVDTLYSANTQGLLYWQMFLAAVSVASSLLSIVLLIFGVKNKVVNIIQAVSIIASAAMFVMILISTGNAHLVY